MNDEQIKYMVNRFLAWKLPANFAPDAGISFKAAFNEHTTHPMKHEPSGTNLFDVNQADAMVRYMIDGMPPLRQNGARAKMMTQEQADVLITYIEALSERTNHQSIMQHLGEDGLSETELDAACRALSALAERDFSIL